MAEHKIRQTAKRNTVYKEKVKKKKKQDDEKIVSKKQQSQAKRAAAEKSGRAELKKTGNQHADERRTGAIRARKNPVNMARGGFQNYVINDKAQGIATAPSKIVSGTLKNAQNTAGTNRHRTNTKSQTQRTDRMTAAQKARQNKAAQEEKQRLQKINEQTKENKKNGYAYGDNVIKSADKLTKKINKSFDKNKEEALNMGASTLSDKKVDIPFYTKYAQGKAEAEAKKALKEGGVTQKQGKKNVDKWITDTEKDWKSQGYDVKDDVVVTEDGKTWGQIKQEAYDKEAARIDVERSKYMHQIVDNAGKMSAQDLYKGGVEMASEFIDYGVPYMATAKGSIKVAEKILAKAAKAGKAGTKSVPKIEHAVEDLVKNGTLSPKAAAKLNRKIALKSGAKSFTTEFVANALQDATIGTALDLGKGINQGLKGDDLEKYMKDNAIANLALGLPMSGIAGKAGAKDAKLAMSMDYAKAINDAVNITKPEAIKLENLMKKQENGTITGAETETLKKLQEKALGEGQAVVNSKGKIEANKTSFATDDLTKAEATEYFKLKAQSERGSIDSRDIPRFNELRGKVESAYRAAEAKAEQTINISGRKITSAMQENAEAAVRFYERTGDKAKLKQAQSVMERAQKATVAKNEALATNLDKMNDITNGNYRWVDSAEMENLSGDGKLGGYYDEATGEIVVNRDSPQAFQTIIGHETMHMMKAANREGYDKLANMLTDYVKELGEYDSLLAEAKRAYQEDALKASRGDVDALERLDEEVVSEMLGRYVFGEDDKFIKKLAKEDPTTLQKIIDYIKKLFADNKNEELAKQLADIEETALEEIRKTNPSAIEKGDGAKVKSSKFGTKGATDEVQRALGEQAEKMYAKGISPKEIFEETGWVVDSDGKAKMRFSDRDMNLAIKMKDLKPARSAADIQKASDAWGAAEDAFDAAVARNADDAELGRLLGNIQKAEEALEIAQNGVKEIPLGKLIDHEELFKRYPDLKHDITVRFSTKSYIGGEGMLVDTGGNTFTLYVRRGGLTQEKLKETLVHEIQHAIQRIEGFSKGSSPETWQGITKKIRSQMDGIEKSLPSGFAFEKDGNNWVIRDNKTGSMSSATKLENMRFDNFSGVDIKELRSKLNEWVELKTDYDNMTAHFKNSPQNVRDTIAEQGNTQYYHTKGEWEARQAEAERNLPDESIKALDEEEANGKAVVTFEHADGKTEDFLLKDKNELKVEEYREKYGKKKASKFSKQETQNAKTSRETVNATKSKIKSLNDKLSGKLSAKKRAEVEDQLIKLEESLEKETAAMHQANTPIYEKRIKESRKAIKELEKQLKKTKDAKEIAELQKQIKNKERWITTNENWINWKPKQVVNDTPVKELTDGELSHEYNTIKKQLQGEQKSIKARNLREERLDAISKEAEKRELDLRGNLERADELIKEKRFGYEEAEELTKKIRTIDEQIKEINAQRTTEARVNKKNKLKDERRELNTRLSQVIENSKSVIPEGESPIDAFNKTVGGNTLKAKGEGKMLNKFSVTKLLEENDGSAKGALQDVGQSIRRKTESSLIEYESAGKRLIKDGHKELGQALLDQSNNVIVYKNKAAAAIETHRANADGTKVGRSLNDIFKVEDKNGKLVDLLQEENTKMRQDLSNYLFAKHSFAREVQGKKVFGVIGEDGKPKWTNASTQEFMDAIVKEYGEKTVKEFEKGIREFIDYLNEYRLDTGLASKELIDKLNDIYPYYIPTNRSVINKPPKEYELPKNTAEVENGIKRAVGGDAPLEDLYTQLVKMTMATIRSGEQNKLLAMYAKAHNIEATRLPKDATADDVLDSSVEAFDSDHKGNWKVRFYDHGEAVTIPVNKHAAKGLREFNGQDYATLMEVSAKSGQLLHLREYKGLITDWNVVFGVRNGMRDAQQALVNSKDSRWYIKSLPRAMAAITNENNAFRILYDANGGRYSTLQQINRLDEIGALNKGKSTVAKGLEKIEDFNGIIEMKPRMQEFIGTIQKEADNILGKDGVDKLMKDIEAEAKAKPEGERTAWIEEEYAKRIVDIIKKEKPDIIATAIRNAADITVNFSRSGVFTKALNAGFVPYLNPSIQGLSKMMRMFTETKSNGLLALGGFMGRLTLLTAAPAVFNEIMCQGNEAYQSLNTRDKDNNFFIPMSLFGGEKDKFIKIPKPRENSVLAEPFEYGYRWLFQNAEYGNKDDFKQMFESALDNVGVVNVWEDNIFSPVFDTMQNETWYGGKILSDQELKNIKNGEAWKNYDETSTAIAKKIGKMMNWSPKKVDNIMDSYMGLIYDFGISQTSQKNINDVYSSPKNFLKNNPIVQQFTKDAVFSNKYATKFWDKVDELNKGHKGDKDTIEKREYMAKYGYDTFTYDTAISNIDNDKNIPKEDKVEMKRELRKYKNQLLHRALNGEEVKYDPMQRIINLYKAHGVKNATDVCLSQYAEGDHADAYKHLKQSKEYRDATDAEKLELQRKFLKTYKGVKRIARFTGDSDNFVNYSTVEYVCVKNGYTGGLIANMYAWKSKEYAVEKGLKDMQKYIDAGYTEKNFKVTMRAMNRGADALGDPDKQYASQLDDYDKAMICAKNGYRDGAYLIASPYIGKARMNAGRCLVEGHSGEDYKWTDKRINKFCKKYDITADKNHKWDLEQVADAVRKEYGDKTPEEQAAVYTVITGDVENNPFGEIGDYSHDNDSGLLEDEEKKGKGGRGRRGRRGGGGGGGSGKGKMPSTSSGAIKGKVTDPFAGSNGSKASNLNDAYRKKVRKLREQTYK